MEFFPKSFYRCLFVTCLWLILQPGVHAQCAEFTSNVEIFADWWSVRPYSTRTVDKNNVTYSGIFPKLLKSLSNQTGIKVHYSVPRPNYLNFTLYASNRKNNTMYFPIMKENGGNDTCFIPVLKTNGPAYIVRVQEVVPLTLLGKGLLQGWQIIALTLVLAAISGVIIWIMDRNANPQDFPPNFVTGVWQGFWWAFVTMTTVGYGDTAPRSIPARLYSILWMIIGMIAFSVLTANITSSLSQKTFEAEEKMFGKKVGVLKGTMDEKAALMEYAHMIDHDSVSDLLSSLETKRVDGILVERYVAGAYYNKYKQQGMELGTLITFPYQLGMQAPSHIKGWHGDVCTKFSQCVHNILEEEHIATKELIDISNEWQDFETTQSNSLFENKSFFYILIAVFFVLLGVGGLWHYFVFIPKQRQAINSATKGSSDEDGISHQEKKFIVYKTEVEMLCLECRPKLESIIQENEGREYIHFDHGAPNSKMFSINAFDQLKQMPSNAAGILPRSIVGRKKAGRMPQNTSIA